MLCHVPGTNGWARHFRPNRVPSDDEHSLSDHVSIHYQTMELRLEDVIVLDHPHDALRRVTQHLDAHPNAKVVAFVQRPAPSNQGAETPQRHALRVSADLLPWLDTEKVIVAEPQLFPKSILREFGSMLTPELATSVTASLAVFKTTQLRNHLAQMSKELGEKATVSDLSVFLNRLGYSSVSVPVAETQLESLSFLQPEDQVPREWDAYVEHVNRVAAKLPTNFFATFAAVLTPHARPRVLLDASGLTNTVNGTARTVFGFLRDLDVALQRQELEWDVTVIMGAAPWNEFSQTLRHLRAVSSFAELDSRFDLGLALTPLTSMDRCINLTQTCLRWGVVHLDVIALRALTHFSQQTSAREALRFYAEFADLVVFISNFSRDDAEALVAPQQFASAEVILMGVPDDFAQAAVSERQASLENGTIFIAGNDAAHKQTELAATALLEAGHRVVTISHQPPLHARHSVLSPGSLSDEALKSVMNASPLVVFPSTYEGFGLPIAEAALLTKPIVLSESAVNREVVMTLHITNVRYFENFAELPALVEQLVNANKSAPSYHVPMRKISDFNSEIRQALTRLLDQPVNVDCALRRWNVVRFVAAAAEERETRVSLELQSHFRESLTLRGLVSRVRRKFRRSS